MPRPGRHSWQLGGVAPPRHTWRGEVAAHRLDGVSSARHAATGKGSSSCIAFLLRPPSAPHCWPLCCSPPVRFPRSHCPASRRPTTTPRRPGTAHPGTGGTTPGRRPPEARSRRRPCSPPPRIAPASRKGSTVPTKDVRRRSRSAARRTRCSGRRTSTSTVTARSAPSATERPTRGSSARPPSPSPTASPSTRRDSRSWWCRLPAPGGTTRPRASAAVPWPPSSTATMCGTRWSGTQDPPGSSAKRPTRMARALGLATDPAVGGVHSGVTYILFRNSEVAPIEDAAAAARIGDELARRFVASRHRQSPVT